MSVGYGAKANMDPPSLAGELLWLQILDARGRRAELAVCSQFSQLAWRTAHEIHFCKMLERAVRGAEPRVTQ